MRVASTFSCSSAWRPPSTSACSLGGIVRTNVYWPASRPASTWLWLIMAGGVNCGGKKAEAMRPDSGEPSSSTMAIEAMCRVSGLAVAAT